jgi:hypothetical protein
LPTSSAAACAFTSSVSARSFSPCRSAAMSAVSNHSRDPDGTATSFARQAHTDRHSGRIVKSANRRIACS